MPNQSAEDGEGNLVLLGRVHHVELLTVSKHRCVEGLDVCLRLCAWGLCAYVTSIQPTE